MRTANRFIVTNYEEYSEPNYDEQGNLIRYIWVEEKDQMHTGDILQLGNSYEKYLIVAVMKNCVAVRNII